VIGEIFIQRVSLLGRLARLDASSAFEQVRVVLMRFAADETIEILKAAASGGPVIEWTNSTAFPNRHFMAFAKLRGRVTIELESFGQRRAGVRLYGIVAGR